MSILNLTSMATAVLAVCLLNGCAERKPPTETPRPVKTLTVSVETGSENYSQVGEIQPRIETDIGFQLDGRLRSRNVEVGDRVAVGDVIATLDDTTVGNDMRVAQAEVDSTTATESAARASLERHATLYEKRLVAKEKFDEVKANWNNASARKKAALATLENARRRLAYATLRASTPGIVTAVGANVGQVVQAGQMVVRIASGTDKEAVFDVSEKLVQTIPMDIDVKVALISDPSIATIGTVRIVSPIADPVTRTFRVRVSLPDAPTEMELGTPVTGSVRLPVSRQIALPASALTSDDKGPAVYIVDPKTMVLSRKPIEVSRYTDAEIFVNAGLSPGDVVVTAGVSKVRPGQVVAMEGAGR